MKRESRILWDPDDTWISEELVNDLVARENTVAMKSRPGVAKVVPDGNPIFKWLVRDDDGAERVYVTRSASLPSADGGRPTFVLDVFLGNRWHAHCTWDQFEAVVTEAWNAHCDAKNKTVEQKDDELAQGVKLLDELARSVKLLEDAVDKMRTRLEMRM